MGLLLAISLPSILPEKCLVVIARPPAGREPALQLRRLPIGPLRAGHFLLNGLASICRRFEAGTHLSHISDRKQGRWESALHLPGREAGTLLLAW